MTSHIKSSNRAQSAMEYLMTYGWAILVIAIIVSLLFALGLFSGGSGTPSGCVPQSGFSCTNPSYGTNGISATISQDSGQYYLGAWVFVASSSEYIGSSGLPVNFSASSANNMLYIGALTPSQSTTFYYTNTIDTEAGDIPTNNVPVGYPFTGYIWLGYCTTPGCNSPTSFAKVGTINVKSSGSGSFGGGSTIVTSITSTSTTSTSTTTTSTSSTSTSTTSIPYAAITLTNSQSSSTGTDFQQMINITSSTCSSCASYENLNLSNVEFTTGPANTGTVLYAWIENGTSNTASKTMIWVNLGLNAIAAGGTQTIYMNFLPMSSNAPVTDGYTGYAPQHYCAVNCMQTTYGQYDNGQSVFNQYWNFTGSSMPSGWTTAVASGSVSSSDGLTETMPSPTWGDYAETTSTSSDGSVFETLTSQSAPNNNGALTSLIYTSTTSLQSPSYALMDSGNPNTAATVYGYQNGGSGFPWTTVGNTKSEDANLHVFSIGITPSGTLGFSSYDYSSMAASSTQYTITSGYIALQTTSNTAFYQWARVRTYPPNGVMPSYQSPFSVT